MIYKIRTFIKLFLKRTRRKMCTKKRAERPDLQAFCPYAASFIYRLEASGQLPMQPYNLRPIQPFYP